MNAAGDRLSTYQEAFTGSVSRIAPARRHLPLEQAVAIVLEEHATRGVTLPEESARLIARRLLWHPMWSLLRPVRARK